MHDNRVPNAFRSKLMLPTRPLLPRWSRPHGDVRGASTCSTDNVGGRSIAGGDAPLDDMALEDAFDIATVNLRGAIIDR